MFTDTDNFKRMTQPTFDMYGCEKLLTHRNFCHKPKSRKKPKTIFEKIKEFIYAVFK